MTAQATPRRDSANLAANEASSSDSRSPSGTCPLMNAKVQLLPLRYGLTEGVDPSAELAMPFALKSRPLGLRLVRNGYLYVIDGGTGKLHEYRIDKGAIDKLLWQDAEVRADIRSRAVGEPQLVFPRTSILYVAYSELQWTARKCMQVLASPKDREHFMQAVDLRRADPQQGGPHLLTRRQAETWLAEVVQNKVHRDEQGQQRFPPHQQRPASPPAAHPDERRDYVWEDPPLFRDTQLGELTAQVLPQYEHDALFLALRDDIGVMRDLAAYQDEVVGWLEEWLQGGAQAGANERDYVIACYIESLTQIRAAELPKLADESAQPLFDDLDRLPPPERERSRQALLDYLNGEPLPKPMDPAMPEPLHRPVERHFTKRKMAVADPAFVERNLDALIRLKKSHGEKVDDALHGAKFGQRGIDDLIDRPAMDAFLAANRPNLARWNALLEQISADRTQMLTEQRFHRAAWYYDFQQAEQLGLAFATQYACLKDICRSDEASEAVLAFLEENPQYDRPLFQTLPLNTQAELIAQYAQLGPPGHLWLSKLKEWAQQRDSLELGKLPALDGLPEATRALADSAQATLNPALTLGISRTMEGFFKSVGQQQAPDLDALFRKLPKALPGRLLDAAVREGVTFTIASEAEKAILQADLKEVLEQRAELRRLVRQRKQVKSQAGHKSTDARALLADIQRVRLQLNALEPRLAAALSPIAELPDNSIRLAGATPGRAGITLILPSAQLQEVASGIRNLRNGYSSAAAFNKVGDGIGLAVFVAQFVNMVQVWRGVIATSPDKRELMPLAGSIFTTISAGVAAAQAIADTALQARSAQLAQGLQNHAVEVAHVQMGKLHLRLGFVGYAAGFFAAAVATQTHYGEWLGAIRSGNAQAQQGAALAMVGSSGMLASSAYGVWHTGYALKGVLRAATPAAERTAWALAGTRLSSIFARFNIAGAIFTALELVGTYWYNRSNTTPHDDWLLSTPWSRDIGGRLNQSLEIYQQRLLGIVQTPRGEVKHASHGSWWRDLLSSPATAEISLALPGISLGALQQTLAGRPEVRLSLAAYRIRSVKYERGSPMVRWFPVTEVVGDSLQVASAEPLVLLVPRLAPLEGVTGGSVTEDLLLAVQIERLNPQGQYHADRHMVRLSPHSEGDYPASPQRIQGQEASWMLIDPRLLPDFADAPER